MVRTSALIALLVSSCMPHRVIGPPVTPDPGGRPELRGEWWFPPTRTPNQHPILGCVTQCGIHAVGTVKCDTLALAEKAAVIAYEKHAGLKATDMCNALSGWRIFMATPGEVSDAGIWWEKDPVLPVYGVTDCAHRELYLAIDDWENGALAHELGHVWGCMLNGPAPRLGHSGWTGQGYCKAINEASLLKEDCTLPKFQ